MHTMKSKTKTTLVTGKLPTMQTLLAESRWGRTALHVMCAVRDHHCSGIGVASCANSVPPECLETIN